MIIMDNTSNYYPFIELKRLELNYIISMDKISWWLLKYDDEFKLQSGVNFTSPVLDKTENEKLFVKLYELLDELAMVYNKIERYEVAIKEYHEIKNIKGGLLAWVKKYEYLGDHNYYYIPIEYVSDTQDCLKVKTYYNESPTVFIEKQAFNYLLEFIEIFDELYWINEIYKEGELYIKFYMEFNESRPDELLDFDMDTLI